MDSQLKRYKRYCRKCQGFTLVELLVVISIIALLTAIMVPAIGKVRGNAKRIQCASQLRQISLAIQSYAQNNNQQIIKAGEMVYAHSVDEVQSMWFIKLLPYISKEADEKDVLNNTTELWICPEDKNAYPRGFLNCPHNPMTSYAPNGYYPQRNALSVPAELRLGPAGGYKFTDIKQSSSCMLMGETSYAAQFYDADAPAVVPFNLPRDGHHRCTSGFYHNSSMNILFVDGHLKNIKGEKTSSLVWPPYFEKPHQNGIYTYWPNLTLPSAEKKTAFWGPGY